MSQPLPQKIKETHPNASIKTFNTLLIDGSNILHLSMADKTVSSNGKYIGAVFQFLLQMKILLKKCNFRYVYVMWDGIEDYRNRRRIYSEYKTNRELDQDFDEGELSPYMKAVNERIRSMQNYFFNQKPKNPERIAKKQSEKELFFEQRDIIMQCLEELFVRQCIFDYTEADDLIAYYVRNKKKEERIVIASNDRDISQLISEDVNIWIQNLKKFVKPSNHSTIMGYHYSNIALKKIICGDNSDNIKGIKGVGEKTLIDNFPAMKERKVELEEIVDGARKLNEERARCKKKPLRWAENIVNRVTDGVQGDMIYEINRRIIDLSNPPMEKGAMDMMDEIMYAPIDPTDRNYDNLYKIIEEYDIDSLKDPHHFANFFSDFDSLAEYEKKDWISQQKDV